MSPGPLRFRVLRHRRRSAILLVVLVCILARPAPAGTSDYVIQISVDGLGSPYLAALLSGNQLPNFARLHSEGAWTHNARADYDITVTLPNHVTMVTGRGVAGASGHNWTGNSDPAAGQNIHDNKGAYVASVFDVVHDNGLRTGLFAGKSKFSLIDTSYNATYGGLDLTGPDNGRDKIDTCVYSSSSGSLVAGFIAAMNGSPFHYSLVHLRDPDVAGSWGGTGYNSAVKVVDGYLGDIFNLVETNLALRDRTTIIVTADHGGSGNDHSNQAARLNYTVPFCVWGPGATAGADLYALNPASRADPGTGRPTYSAPGQPIRNGDGANLALGLLGLGPVPGSTINSAQDLAAGGVAPSPPAVIAYTAFNETPIGIRDWAAGAGDTELGFATTVIVGNLSPGPVLGSYDSTSSPRRFRMLGCEAQTAFETVDLSLHSGVTASIDILIKNTTYESDDYYRATLTNGTDTIVLADVQGAALNGLPKGVFINYAAQIPDSWTQAAVVIASHTNSSVNAEAVDFDHIFFTGTSVPEPGAAALLALGMLALVARAIRSSNRTCVEPRCGQDASDARSRDAGDTERSIVEERRRRRRGVPAATRRDAGSCGRIRRHSSSPILHVRIDSSSFLVCGRNRPACTFVPAGLTRRRGPRRFC